MVSVLAYLVLTFFTPSFPSYTHRTDAQTPTVQMSGPFQDGTTPRSLN